MAGLAILGGAGVDRTERNLEGVIYILGDEFTDGSIRLIVGDNDQVQVEKRINGIWNLGEFEASGDILGGDNLVLSREADLTFDRDGNFIVGRTV